MSHAETQALPAATATGRPARLGRALPLVAALAAVAALVAWWPSDAADVALRTAEVSRGDVRATVSATGSLGAVQSVEVGTQVSGIVEEILVDFNDTVTAGQVIARIDPALLDADIASAKATLSLRLAEHERAAKELQRTERLDAAGAATLQELEVARASAAAAAAQVEAARIALDRAERNRGYATIASPIDGTVIVRDVEVGQTVNAGMSAPRLFVIAGELDRMQILATVDEADIGRVQPGQPVEFTVQAYPGQRFDGTVRQVRLQSTVAENIVTYTVIVDVDNPGGELLPGMTATVDFVVDAADDALLVPNAALRYRPRGAAPTAGPTVWVLEGEQPVPVAVSTTITDGRHTAVTAPDLTEGALVVTGVQAAREESGPTSPFQAQSSGRRGPGGF